VFVIVSLWFLCFCVLFCVVFVRWTIFSMFCVVLCFYCFLNVFGDILCLFVHAFC